MTYYTGIGSRETPEKTLKFMTVIAEWLYNRNYVLRSGGADGADSAFEKGAGNRKEIYLPWKGFNNNLSSLYSIPKEAFEIASRIHPAWEKCTPTVRKLHARNVLQVWGKDLHTFSRFVICWTKEGKYVGGTATAIKLAEKVGIPVFNLAIKSHREKIKKRILETQNEL